MESRSGERNMEQNNDSSKVFIRNVLGARSTQLLSIHPSVHQSIHSLWHIHRAPQAKKKVQGKGGKGERTAVGAGLSGATRLRSCMYVYGVYG